jgi:hypothetical protein
MAKFSEEDRLILDRILSDPASNAVVFKESAMSGGYRSDEGLENVLPADWTRPRMQAAVRSVMLTHLREGGAVTRSDDPGDVEMGRDPQVLYEFRITVEQVRLFVKVRRCDENPTDPTIRVISVKRQD